MKIEDVKNGQIVYISKVGMTCGMKAIIVENDSTEDKIKVKFDTGFQGYYKPEEMIKEDDYKNYDKYNTEFTVRFNKLKDAEKLYNEYKEFIKNLGFIPNEITGKIYKE